MKRYHQLSYEERQSSITKIAKALGRSKSTISRELRRNEAPPGKYWPDTAQRQTQERRRRGCLLDRHLELQQAVRTFLSGKAIKYLVRHYEKLTQFCRVAGALIDNNRMEETLKLMIRNRKTAHFFKTVNGAGVANVLTSIIATAMRAKVNLFEYLTILQRHQAEVASDPKAWLPWDYQNTLQKITKGNNLK